MTHEARLLPPERCPPANEGRTRAAWTLVAGGLVGLLCAVIGVVSGNNVLLVTGCLVLAAGAIASAILRRRGHGQVRAARSVR